MSVENINDIIMTNDTIKTFINIFLNIIFLRIELTKGV